MKRQPGSWTGVCSVIKRSVPTFELDLLDISSVFVVKVTNQVVRLICYGMCDGRKNMRIEL
jgi:hypothetical protein